MALQVRNTRQIIDPEHFNLKVLVYGLSGVGKTTWLASAPNVGIVASETGEGEGLLSIADKYVDYVVPTTIEDLEQIVLGHVFKDKATVGLDSLSAVTRTLIKAKALSVPRKYGDTEKRKMGIPELDDYGTMGELTRRVVGKFLDLPQHIVVTATERYDKPDENTPGSELLIGPDLAGQMFLGAPAMFDLVLRMRTRPALKRAGDPKSRYSQRYFITQQTGPTIAKCRSVLSGKPLLDAEEVFDTETGQGSFPYILGKILNSYKEALSNTNKTT